MNWPNIATAVGLAVVFALAQVAILLALDLAGWQKVLLSAVGGWFFGGLLRRAFPPRVEEGE